MAENLIEATGLLINKKKQPNVKSPDFISIYANNVQLEGSVFDFALSFGEMTPEIKNGMHVVNQKARVILSKEMTKVLSALLNANIAAYEKQFGEIVLPRPAGGATNGTTPAKKKRRG